MMALRPQHHQDQSGQTLAKLFDVPVSIGVTAPRHPQPALAPSEWPAVKNALPKRRSEFAAGRAAARRALDAVGRGRCAIPAQTDGAPIWPPGISGSISHTSYLCIAGVTEAFASIGLDVEGNEDLDAELIPIICGKDELYCYDPGTHGRWAKVIFSVKEAVFKAQYPLTGQLIGFDHLSVSLDTNGDGFTATFIKPAGRFLEGSQIGGRFRYWADHVVCAAEIPLSGD